jgi:hypothetical protein
VPASGKRPAQASSSYPYSTLRDAPITIRAAPFSAQGLVDAFPPLAGLPETARPGPPDISAGARTARARHLNAGAPVTCGMLAERHALVTAQQGGCTRTMGTCVACSSGMAGQRSWRVPGAGDDAAAEARQRDAEARVARVIAGAAGVANETLDVRSANGRIHVWLAGSHNHRDEAVIGLFRSIAEAAPGSYG